MTLPSVRWDRAANAATITFDDTDQISRGFEVNDDNGDVVAVLHFVASGELTRIQLLEAATQLPRSLRKGAQEAP